ncbi:hypothetical protein [Paenibacillus agricola]|uniref:Uncharacterized protein n=1 Tax=Paenibacillus agricola TaxID=2716264 RepID=A0ABX0JB18_9BACL|nr:hypothetical protein [Paenibacillus agricola]NHN33665.1 hypothetical protein [Paenibacillus agricola]
MSKKLEGNGLWESSRMMLPQHKEQSMQNQSDQPHLALEPPTKKDLQMMRDFVILPFALKIVEKKSIEVEMSSLTLKLLYSSAAKILAKCMREDVQKSKKILVERHIRVFEDSKDDTELIYRYICRGHEDRFVVTKDFMREEISRRIGSYAKSLIVILQEAMKSK